MLFPSSWFRFGRTQKESERNICNFWVFEIFNSFNELLIHDGWDWINDNFVKVGQIFIWLTKDWEKIADMMQGKILWWRTAMSWLMSWTFVSVMFHSFVMGEWDIRRVCFVLFNVLWKCLFRLTQDNRVCKKIDFCFIKT